ncbi:helix-turn-helix domain-containing protein [Adhaeribacter swui]|uniref:Helix-turn-helix domain-containing protein n=1 Tax=Adhaeribacter swui TaxID=2086471 RepID=A0A7G7G6F7_9BACT|nr:helix-turn-helix domain-containing protein [Adhaeribacter swui]QNF32741.1 helix-turn-helix domain-containing protein [Adhaeribacter swui]
MSVQAVQYILVGGALQGVCLAFLLATRKANQLANKLLAALILLISAQSVLVAFDTREFFLAFPHLSKVGWLLPTLFAPLIYLFIQKLTAKRPRIKPVDGVHFLPFLLTFVYLLPYFLKSTAEKIAYLSNFELARKDDFGFLGQITLFLILLYLALSLWELKKYRHKIENTFSEVEQIRLQWLRQFIYALLSILFVASVAFYAQKWGLPVLTIIYKYHLHYFGVVFLIYWVGYKTLSQPRIFLDKPSAKPKNAAILLETAPVLAAPMKEKEPIIIQASETPAPANSKYQKSVLKPEDSQLYLNQLLEYMEQEKPYRQSNLTIQELADTMQMPKHHLSQVINERLGKNFYDFINQYRVAEAQLLLVDPKYRHLTNLAVAEEAGFNSKATFNAVFKKQTGQTPSEYVKNQHQNRPNLAD